MKAIVWLLLMSSGLLSDRAVPTSSDIADAAERITGRRAHMSADIRLLAGQRVAGPAITMRAVRDDTASSTGEGLKAIRVLEDAAPGSVAYAAVSGDGQMQLGNFSVSLAVKDIAASRAFYEKLGFKQVAGDQAQNWLILQNSTSTIGLFQGRQYTRNMLTFNPGWDRTGNTLPEFDDVRDIQRTIKGRGLVPTAAADESSTGPASMVLTDPDGNPILIDQHVPKPRK